ncbi:peptide chain release factor subunit 1, putative [Plasmodium ovale curtisi]|uniref:Peptide chain release factor subunit 1, putative n=1 Tax=Plasmodium ovale curtisi TaxID=864141 RepID=A0A1A8VMK4_PLAOA|nr:peptide chain release factor subunit 1, putative [Plasmodium ovale curtisi]
MEEDRDANVEQWKIKRLIKKLENAKGNGTSMISLIIKNKDEVSRINKMLADELGTASNIKSRVNRLSVLSAITSTQQSNKNERKGAYPYCAIPFYIYIMHTCVCKTILPDLLIFLSMFSNLLCFHAL